MRKIKGFLVKIGVLVLIFAVVAGVWFLLNRDSYSEFVVYKHDKLFHDYMQTHEFSGEPVGEEQTVYFSENGKFKVTYSSKLFLIIDGYHGYGFTPRIYGVDKNGNTVCDFEFCKSSRGYYDPLFQGDYQRAPFG